MSKKIVSPKMSMKGWHVGAFAKGYFMGFIKGNWGTIKNILKALAPMVLTLIATRNPAIVASVTVIGKGLLDIAEYYFKEKTA